MPVRRFTPIMAVPSHHTYSSPRHDYDIDSSLQRADYLSHATLEDTWDAASRSRNKDKDLIRNVNSAIRPSRPLTSSYRQHYNSRNSSISPPPRRFHSLPPANHSYRSRNIHDGSIGNSEIATTSKALVPYRGSQILSPRKNYLDDLPPPTSLLSSKVNSFLKTPSPRTSYISSASYKTLLPTDDIRNKVSLRLADPAVQRLLDKPSPSDHLPESLVSQYRSLPSPYVSRSTAYNDSEDDEDYVPYQRKYRVTPSYANDAESDDGDDDGYSTGDYGTYSCPRPSNLSSFKLSSYDGDYDGSYDADMADMYDYVPFGPSKHGILEITSSRNGHKHIDYDIPQDDDYSNSSYHPPLTSTSSYYPSVLPSTTTSVIPGAAANLPSPVIDSLVSNTAAKARELLQGSDYKDASLVFTVEGSALSDDGSNRYGFRYYPPPIPIKGSGAHLGIDERLLSIHAPSRGNASPADSLFIGYLDRLRDIRAGARESIDRGEYARGRSVTPAQSSPSSYLSSYRHPSVDRFSPATSSFSSPPSVSLAASAPYSHSRIHVPVNITGGRHTSVPVSSYRSRLGDGYSHRVDVFPLVETEARLPSSSRSVHLPSTEKLSVLEKINIKAAIIGSKMEPDGARGSSKGPRSQFAKDKLREMHFDELQRKYK